MKTIKEGHVTHRFYEDPFCKAAVEAVETIQKNTITIRDRNFVKKALHDTQFISEDYPVIIGISWFKKTPVCFSTVKVQKKGSKKWGKYATHTNVFCDRAFRHSNIGFRNSRLTIDLTKADRVKNLIMSPEGMCLNWMLGSKFWGIDSEGSVIADTLLFGEEPPTLFGEDVPSMVKYFCKMATNSIPYGMMMKLFEKANYYSYKFRGDPEDFLLKGGPKDCGYVKHPMALIRKEQEDGGLHWWTREGKRMKPPHDKLLSTLYFFQDIRAKNTCYYFGHFNGALVYRAKRFLK